MDRMTRRILSLLALFAAIAALNWLFERHPLDRAGVDAMYERGRDQ